MILNVGIDIGTLTARLTFSRLTIKSRTSNYTVPRIDIVDKEVIYRNKIYLTPLRSATEIDAKAVKRIVREGYQAAGMAPGMLRTGAVIITGETTRKENVNGVLEALSDLAGGFVVATTGPDLESVLSIRGVGTDVLSREKRTAITSVNTGDGTGNIVVYEKGVLRGICCLDTGGRLIKAGDGRTSYIFPRIQALAATNGISLTADDQVYLEQLYSVCRPMTAQLAQALRLTGADNHHTGLYTNNDKPLPEQLAIRAVTHSGGVTDYIYQEMEGSVFRFGDIGVLLGRAIRADPDLNRVEHFTSIETVRATVVGAGTHTTEVSGSAIHHEQGTLPLKNVPILKVSEGDEASLETLRASILNQMPLYVPEGKAEQLTIAFIGGKHTSSASIQVLAAAIIGNTKKVISSKYPLVVVVENDIGKVFGNALNILLKREKDVICIDGICTLSGNYIDIGEPVAGGQVLLIVIKTLIFDS